jgi:MOSC domain-containing protein YiiM
MNGELRAIWIKRVKLGPMDPVSHADLQADRGIVGNADQGGTRQVTIIAQEIWSELMRQFQSALSPSTRRANLMVGGIDLANSRNKILQIGAVQLRVRGETKPCERMDQALPGLREAMHPQWRGGAFAQVLNDGTIRTGDPIRWVDLA